MILKVLRGVRLDCGPRFSIKNLPEVRTSEGVV